MILDIDIVLFFLFISRDLRSIRTLKGTANTNQNYCLQGCLTETQTKLSVQIRLRIHGGRRGGGAHGGQHVDLGIALAA